MMRIYLGYTIVQMMIFSTLFLSKKSFGASKKDGLLVAVANISYILMLCGIVLFLRYGPGYFSVEDIGWMFARFLWTIVLLSGLITVVGLINIFAKSKVFYFLCPLGITALFSALNMRFSQSVLMQAEEYYASFFHLLAVSIISTLLLFGFGSLLKHHSRKGIQSC